MKLWNISSYDPNRAMFAGLPNGSRLDKEIWDRYAEQGDALVERGRALLVKALSSKEMFSQPDARVFYHNISFPVGEEREVATAQRINQAYFRNSLLDNYDGKCCVTGIDVAQLLVASHIKPWSVSDPKTERINPENGLLLNALHDKAFDKGLITLNKNYEIVVSSQVKRGNSANEKWIASVEGQRIRLPKFRAPKKEFIEYHNDMVFLG